MSIAIRIIVIIALAIMIMFLTRKFVESFWNLKTTIDASKDKNHPARAKSSEVIYNKKTKKLENCSDIIKLPF